MIKTKILYILPILALSFFVFVNSNFNPSTNKAQNSTNTQIFNLHNTNINQNTKSIKNKKHSLALINTYKHRLAKSNLAKRRSNASQNTQVKQDFLKKNPKSLNNKVKAQASYKNSKEEKEKKEKKDAKQIAEKTKGSKGEKKPVSNKILFEKTNSSSTFSNNNSSIFFNSINLKKKNSSKNEVKDPFKKKNDFIITFNQNPLTLEAEYFKAFSISYFNNLLINEQLQEFSQDLKLILKTKNNSTKLSHAYTAALNFLFTKENEDFILYDNFLRTQFLKHSLAVSISKTFSDKTLSLEQIEYSAELLNDLVLSWDSSKDENNQFIQIYELSVLNAINPDIANNEALLTLQSSITTTLFNISNSSVEISAN